MAAGTDRIRTLGLDVIAEGVETRQQIDFLLSHQYDEMQGNYFGMPMTVSQVDRLLREGYTREGACLFRAHYLPDEAGDWFMPEVDRATLRRDRGGAT